jgi:hypothetical protein
MPTTSITRVIALDLGTKTGFASRFLHDASSLTLATWELATKREIRERENRWRDFDPRPDRLRAHLVHALTSYERDWARMALSVWFEDVQFCTSTAQAQLWAGLRSAMWTLSTLPIATIQFHAVPVGTLKKFATGAGNATKEMMKNAAPRSVGSAHDDNAIDAYFLMQYACQGRT